MRSEVSFDDDERNHIESRLDLIYSLKRKYGNTIKEILEYGKNIEDEINKIENLDEYHSKIKKQMKQLKEEMQVISDRMNKTRTKYGKQLSEKINNELSELEMPNAKFEVQIVKQNDFHETGSDMVEFMICTNKGEGMKPLAKIA